MDQPIGMRRKKPLTPTEQIRLDEGWEEMGESIAATILVGGRTAQWAWDLLGPLGLYKRWMIDLWLERYRQEHPEVDRPVGERADQLNLKRKASKRSVFTKKEQIQEALKMLNERTNH
jgi:hypothetical protein